MTETLLPLRVLFDELECPGYGGSLLAIGNHVHRKDDLLPPISDVDFDYLCET